MRVASHPQEFLRRASDIASYYGFSPAHALLRHAGVRRELRQTERMKVVETCASCLSLTADQPVLLFYKNLEPRGGEADTAEFNLEIWGLHKSVAEAILLKTIDTILREVGFPHAVISINSLGDRDSMARYARELGLYYRKRLEELAGPCRSQVMRDVVRVVYCDDEKCRTVHEEAPKAMNFLSEGCRQHFMEILDHLERMELPYQLKETLVGPRDYFSKTIFEIHHGDDEAIILAYGGRYDEVARKVTGNKDMSAVGASLFFKRRGLGRARDENFERKRRARVYFIQLGFEAKLKSLTVLEMLRKAHIPVYQDVSADKLAGQLTQAEGLRIPHIILMGHKEALENTVIVRDMTTRAQMTVPIEGLALYLRKVLS